MNDKESENNMSDDYDDSYMYTADEREIPILDSIDLQYIAFLMRISYPDDPPLQYSEDKDK